MNALEHSRLIVHAGMEKAGSTAIQLWLGRWATDLAQSGIVATRLVNVHGWEPHWQRVVSGSAWSPASLGSPGQSPMAAHEGFASAMLDLLGSWRSVIVSSEGLFRRLWSRDELLIEVLERIGDRFPVDIFIYVRPQDAWAEAGWRQWGFRVPVPASVWIEQSAGPLDYRWARSLAKSLRTCSVRLYPVVDGPAGRTDVVSHFAQEVLGLPLDHPSLSGPHQRENVGLPIAVCAALARMAPTDLWDSPHDNGKIEELKRALHPRLGQLDDSEPAVQWVRRTLNGWARQMFGAANEEMLTDRGWDPVGWPLQADPSSVPVDLRDIDLYLQLMPSPAAAHALAATVEGVLRRPAAPPDSFWAQA